MEEKRARLKLNLHTGEVEIEGSEEFVTQQSANLENIIRVINARPIPEVKQDANNTENNFQTKENINDGISLPENFGEWINKLPKDASDADKLLLAGYFVQRQSKENAFRTREVTKLLKDHGIYLTNPSQTAKHHLDMKRIFQVGKVGTEAKYRVSREQEESLISLLDS